MIQESVRHSRGPAASSPTQVPKPHLVASPPPSAVMRHFPTASGCNSHNSPEVVSSLSPAARKSRAKPHSPADGAGGRTDGGACRCLDNPGTETFSDPPVLSQCRSSTRVPRMFPILWQKPALSRTRRPSSRSMREDPQCLIKSRCLLRTPGRPPRFGTRRRVAAALCRWTAAMAGVPGA